jgi:DNA-binding MarR family transcriptional regulator
MSEDVRTAPPRSPRERDDAVVDAVLVASRALVAVAARSLAGVAEDVTLPQYRALVLLAQRGSCRSVDLAEALAVSPSTASRMADRLVRKGLVTRGSSPGDRRAVLLALSESGESLVRDVMRRRRHEVARILREVPARERPAITTALQEFARAAGEVPEREWSLGWRR